MAEITDHEAILLVRQELQQLKDSQSAFHKEMRESFSDLKNNYQGTLNDHEKRLVDLEATRVDFRQKIEDSSNYMKLVIAIGVLIVGLFIYHIAGYHI